MKILKSKDSEIMNLYFRQQLKKQATYSADVVEGFLKVIKESAPGKTLSEIAADLGKTVEELVEGTGKTADELMAIKSDEDILKNTVKNVSKEVIGPDAIKLLRTQWRAEMSNVRTISRGTRAILLESSDLSKFNIKELDELRQKIVGNKGALSAAKSSLHGITPKMIENSILVPSDQQATKQAIAGCDEFISRLSKKEEEIAVLIKSPDASAAPVGMDATKIEVPKEVEIPKTKTTNINPFDTTKTVKPKTVLTTASNTVAEVGAKELSDIAKKHAESAISEVKKTGKFLDPNTRKQIEQIINNASLSGTKTAYVETTVATSGETSKLIRIAKQEAKAADTAYVDSISKLPADIQGIVSRFAEAAKSESRTNVSKTLDAVVASEQQAVRESVIEPKPSVLPPAKQEVKDLSVPIKKEQPKITEEPKDVQEENPFMDNDQIRNEKFKDYKEDRAQEKWKQSVPGKMQQAIKEYIPTLLWSAVGIISKPLIFAGGLLATGVGGALSVAASSIPLIATIAIVGVGSYYIYNNWIAEKPNMELVAKLHAKLADTSVRINSIKFKEGSEGEILFNEISTVSLRLLKSDLKELSEPSKSDEDLKLNFSSIDLLEKDLKIFLNNKDKYCQDLINPEECDNLSQSLQDLYSSVHEYKSSISSYMTDNVDNVEMASGGIHSQIGSPAKSEETLQQEPDKVPYELQIYDQNVNLAHLSGNIRMSAPRIIGKVFDTPEGMAFIDPANKFGGGFFGRTSEPDKDYLEALKYFYLNRIFDRHELRKFIRANLPTASRRRMGNYREALDYYKKNPFSSQKIRRRRLRKQENLKNLHKNFEKSANVSTLVDKSGNFMKKQADQFSKEYFKDAVKSISEQYSKSYYEGFGKLYDVTPEKTSADYQQLYQNHQETGADLIERAHPKSIYIADAISNGGLIENSIEQHRKMEEVALSMPSGNFRNRYAELIENLVKIANESDEQGLYQSSELIEESVTQIIGNLK